MLRNLITALGGAAVAVVLAIAGLTPGVARADEEMCHPYWSHTASISTTSGCIRSSLNPSVCALFPAGGYDGGPTSAADKVKVQVTAAGAARCCYSMVSGDLASNGRITDVAGPNGTGFCAGFTISAAGAKDISRPRRVDMTRASGYRAGLCSGAITNAGDSCYPPCTSGSDCTALGAGSTCVASPTNSQQLRACVELICESDSGTINVGVTKKRCP